MAGEGQVQDGKTIRHTGARIRDRRLALGLKQGDLAAKAGISASYLNLIEHNKRRIGGKLLNDLSRALGAEPGALTDGPEAALYRALNAAANLTRDGERPAEVDRIDTLAARFPGWAGTIAAQTQRIASLEAMNDALSDRLSHDQVLAEAIHELLSTVAAIRSTAAILAEDSELDPQWRTRFHRNLHEEAERLAERATAIAHHFDEDAPLRDRAGMIPAETVERLFDRAGHHFRAIEEQGTAAIPGLIAAAEGTDDPTAAEAAHQALTLYAADAEALPLDMFAEAARDAAFRPEALYALGQGDMALVLRRLASLPVESGVPEFGLAVCDAAGGLFWRRRHAAYTVPRFGIGCPELPLYRAFARPLWPEAARIELADGTAMDSWSVCQAAGFDAKGRPILQATMLYTIAAQASAPVPAADRVCEICHSANCNAWRGRGRGEGMSDGMN